MDCILVQNGKAHQIWRGVSKSALCFKVHDTETVPRPLFPPETIAAIVEVANGSIVEGATYDGSTFTNPTAALAPTNDEIYDAKVLTDKVVKAIVLAINDGTLAVGANKTPAQLKAIVKAKM